MILHNRVTIGLPIYQGERFLEEALESIQRQTHQDFDAIMSVDTPNAACEAICGKFLDDRRFRLVVQPQRLGWVGQLNWLMTQVTNEFWYFHQQDDVVEPNYIETLLAHARQHSEAAVVYSDILPFGQISAERFFAPSVLGLTPHSRVMTMLREQFPAFAFRGLTRREALQAAGPIPTNDADNFGVDITWLTGVARHGELHRVPLLLYRKRYHENNTSTRWMELPEEDKLNSWSCHCVDMLGQAIKLDASPQHARLFWFAAVSRLTAPEVAGHFLKIGELTNEDRNRLLTAFLDQVNSRHGEAVSIWLDADWDAIRQWTTASFWIPDLRPTKIISFGPTQVSLGAGFNVQQNGQSALWIKTNRHLPPNTIIRLGDANLTTVLSGSVATASVPMALTSHVADLALRLVGPDGEARSDSVLFQIVQ